MADVVPVDQADKVAVAVLVDQAVKVVDVVPAENAEVVDQDVTKKTQVSSNAL